jgi:hypothetical protein
VAGRSWDVVMRTNRHGKEHLATCTVEVVDRHRGCYMVNQGANRHRIVAGRPGMVADPQLNRNFPKIHLHRKIEYEGPMIAVRVAGLWHLRCFSESFATTMIAIVAQNQKSQQQSEDEDVPLLHHGSTM